MRYSFRARGRARVVANCDLRKSVLLVHIPKTAGVSLIKSYSDHFVDARHLPALVYRTVLGEEVFGRFQTLSVVRNPWARLYSAYRFLLSGGLNATDRAMGQVLKRDCPTFESFAAGWLPSRGVCSYTHFVPQVEFVRGWGSGAIVKRLVRLEALDREWPRVARGLGLPIIELPRANVSPGDDFRRQYSDKSAAAVEMLYHEDIVEFGYSFEQGGL